MGARRSPGKLVSERSRVVREAGDVFSSDIFPAAQEIDFWSGLQPLATFAMDERLCARGLPGRGANTDKKPLSTRMNMQDGAVNLPHLGREQQSRGQDQEGALGRERADPCVVM